MICHSICFPLQQNSFKEWSSVSLHILDLLSLLNPPQLGCCAYQSTKFHHVATAIENSESLSYTASQAAFDAVGVCLLPEEACKASFSLDSPPAFLATSQSP